MTDIYCAFIGTFAYISNQHYYFKSSACVVLLISSHYCTVLIYMDLNNH